MRLLCRLIPVVLLSTFAVSCEHSASNASNPAIPQGAVTHMVVLYLNDRGDQTARAEILKQSQTLAAINGVISVTGGEVLPSERPMVDSTYDVGLVITLKSEDDLRRYLSDPVHVGFKKNYLDRYVKQIKIYDFISQ